MLYHLSLALSLAFALSLVVLLVSCIQTKFLQSPLLHRFALIAMHTLVSVLADEQLYFDFAADADKNAVADIMLILLIMRKLLMVLGVLQW